MNKDLDIVGITMCGNKYTYPKGTMLCDIVKDVQDQYDNDILLVNKDGKLCELHKKVNKDASIVPITILDKPGHQTYERSIILLMLKSFYDIVGNKNIDKIEVCFSVNGGLFILPTGRFALDKALLLDIKNHMQELVDRQIPIIKRSVNTDEAIDMFHSHHMYDKERLFRYRRVSRVNIYSLDGFEDYFYGYMVQNTKYLKYFDLRLFHDGFVLLYPSMYEPKKISEFSTSEKVFETMRYANDKTNRLNLSTVGELNKMISDGYTNEIVICQEAIMEKRIGDIAEDIIKKGNKKLVMIAGPSSSGKTTFSHRLSAQLFGYGKIPHPVAVDNYFKNREDTPRDANGEYNFDCLEALDIETFNKDLSDLIDGKTVDMPTFNFKTGTREYKGNTLTIGPDDLIVIEGIHCLNDKLTSFVPRDSKYKIYISALTTMNVDEHNRIPTTDARLIRRIVRDARTRSTSAAETIARWPSVRIGEEENIFPFQDTADIVFNSSLIYELAVLKQYAEPLLFGIDRDSKEYTEAKRFLKFLDYFLGIPETTIPKNSIVREFIGGSCFNV